uniref:NADH-ubiquinone oxidoreductase chain 4 n=1 Tax=Clavaria fumosa TaxID=264083 RepID=A0A7T3U531_9AGAR|nr:NADH dehydrogenase subunit 4 [Clavaria fumosa]QPZ51161.1 NADH dehydrogenase subunit 4 [Clavaria fumosa]
MIALLLIIPIIGSLILIPMKENKINDNKLMKNIALITSIINLLISIIIWFEFDSSTNQYQFVYVFNQLSFFQFNLGLDGISLAFVLITTFITPIALLSNHLSIANNLKHFLISILLLETLQIALFTVLDLLLFYVFFESIAVIFFILIIVYGSGKDKVRSATLLFLYTFAGSLPMLLAILTIYNYVGSTDFTIISLSKINLEYQKILFFCFFIAFAVKTPLWPFHIWLPKAHGDSNLAGSILLAATVLKFSTYGILRILINFLPDATNYFIPFVQTIAIITLIYASFATIVQEDTKKLIAYSSVCHMAIVTLGLFSNTIVGIEGAILLAVAHAFVSPALFICLGGVVYERIGTRNISYIRGLVNSMPIFTIFFFIFTLANTGVPLSLNWLGEIMSLTGTFQKNPFIAVLGASGIVLSACYSIFLYNRISYGSYSPHLPLLKDISRREFYLLLSLLIPTFLLGIFPNVILDTLHVSVTSLLYNTQLTPL